MVYTIPHTQSFHHTKSPNACIHLSRVSYLIKFPHPPSDPHTYPPRVGPHSCISFSLPPNPSPSFFNSVPSVCNCFLNTLSSLLFRLNPLYIKNPPTAITTTTTPSKIATISPACNPPFCCCTAGTGIVELFPVSNNCVAVAVAVCMSVILEVKFCVSVFVCVTVMLFCTVDRMVS